MPASKAWRASRASLGLGPSPDRAVGADRPELKPLEKTKVFAEGGSPLLRGKRRSRRGRGEGDTVSNRRKDAVSVAHAFEEVGCG